MVEREEKPSSSVDLIVNPTIIDLDDSHCDEISVSERKYFALLARCELMKQSNERLVNRIYHVKKLLRRRKKERKFLMDRLDSYGDDYRNAALQLFSDAIGDAEGVSDLAINSPGVIKRDSSQSFPLQLDSDL